MNVGRIIASHVGTGMEALTKAAGGAKRSIIAEHVGTEFKALKNAVGGERNLIAEHIGVTRPELKAMFDAPHLGNVMSRVA